MKILFYGDSITDAGRNRNAGDGYLSAYGYGYPLCVAGELLAKDPTKYQIINRGISGNRIVDLYARIKADVWNHHPDVISILIGINDIWHELGQKNGVDLPRFEKIFKMMIEDTLARLPNAKIVILEPFVLHGNATDEFFEEFSRIKAYAAAEKRIADELGLDWVPLQETLDKAAEKFGAAYFLEDGVHPTAAGARLIANEWLRYFKTIDK